jgi:hypothetical protein
MSWLNLAQPGDAAGAPNGAERAGGGAPRPTEFARLVREVCENGMMNASVILLDGAAHSAGRISS